MAPRLNPEVIARRLGDGAVLVHLPTSRIFELNETGMRVWELVAQGLDAAGISAKLGEEYDVDAGDAARQIDRVISQLQAEGLMA